eukprot:2958-Heterococcus_DN1.PRE.2
MNAVSLRAETPVKLLTTATAIAKSLAVSCNTNKHLQCAYGEECLCYTELKHCIVLHDALTQVVGCKAITCLRSGDTWPN